METTTLSGILSDIEENMSNIANLPTTVEETSEYLKSLITILQEFAVSYGGKLIGAIILLIIGFKLTKVITKKVSSAKVLNKIDASTKGFVASIINVLLKIFVAITALAVLGVPMTSMIAVIGSCGLAIGLALQGSLANIAGGFIILVFKPFSVGDYVIAGGVEGSVEDIGIFHTKLLTVDNKRIIVPNSTISNATLTNVSALKERRVDLTFTASYNADIEKVEKTLLAVVNAHEKVLKNPEPFARLSAHKDSALEYTVRAWCKAEDYWTVYFDIIKQVKYAFDREDIAIPYPQLDVHTDK